MDVNFILFILLPIFLLLSALVGINIFMIVKAPKVVNNIATNAVNEILRGVVSTPMEKEVIIKESEPKKQEINVTYKLDYSKTTLSNKKRCQVAQGRCDEERCYAFSADNKNKVFRCNEYFLEFTNYLNKEDR